MDVLSMTLSPEGLRGVADEVLKLHNQDFSKRILITLNSKGMISAEIKPPEHESIEVILFDLEAIDSQLFLATGSFLHLVQDEVVEVFKSAGITLEIGA